MSSSVGRKSMSIAVCCVMEPAQTRACARRCGRNSSRRPSPYRRRRSAGSSGGARPWRSMRARWPGMQRPRTGNLVFALCRRPPDLNEGPHCDCDDACFESDRRFAVDCGVNRSRECAHGSCGQYVLFSLHMTGARSAERKMRSERRSVRYGRVIVHQGDNHDR